MIQQLISSLIALTIAFHAVLGCCAHHTHSHDHSVCEQSTEHDFCHEQGDCESDHQHEIDELQHQHPLVLLNGRQSSQNDPQHQHHPCGELDCQFVSDVRVLQSDLIRLNILKCFEFQNALVSNRYEPRLSTESFSSFEFYSSGSRSAPTCLKKQVWLL